MEKVFNKLVRDNIPKIIIENHEVPITRILEDNEYKKELYKKLEEEVKEVITANSKEETIEELADVYEVISAIAKLYDSNIEEVKETSKQKKLKRGGFDKKIYLEKTIKERK